MSSRSDLCGYFGETGQCNFSGLSSGGLLCILHVDDPSKDRESFQAALLEKIKGDEENSKDNSINLDGIISPQNFQRIGTSGALEFPKDLKKWVSFKDARFPGTANLSGITFKEGASFKNVTFSGAADFSAANFKGSTDFEGATFTGGAYFLGANFWGEASFRDATFTQGANFEKAVFANFAFFYRATFSSNAYFHGATFTQGAYFELATFTQDVDFKNAKFSQNAYFRDATFTQGAKFERASFSKNAEADFRGTRFKGTLSFEGDGFPDKESRGEFLFQNVVLEKAEEVSFVGVDLSRVSFLQTDMENVRFIGVKWPKKIERWCRLPFRDPFSVVFDHLELERSREESGGALVGEEYRQLRVNYERRRQEIEARHFYIGQMDMRLKGKELRLDYKLLLRVYRWLALYGESFLRPLAVYFLLGLLLAFAYLWGGFSFAGKPFLHPPTLNPAEWGFYPGDYIEALFIALTAGTLTRPEFAVGASWLRVIQFLNIVGNVFLIAVFVIALRRQFRR